MRVLFATDGSKNAATALAYLKSFPLPTDAKLRAVSVADIPLDAIAADRSRPLTDLVLEHARGIADRAATALKTRWSSADAVVIEGDAREGIVRAAEDWNADLIVLGARGLSRAKRFLIGSVSCWVARHAPCPVLVVNRAPRTAAPVLIAIDGSEAADEAVRFLSSFPLRNVLVQLLGVVEPVHFPSMAPAALHTRLTAVIEDIRAERTSKLKHALGRAAATLRGTGASILLSVRKGPSVADVIVAKAEADAAGLVVLGARGLGGVKRLPLGRVPEEVLRYAPCPVLVVKQGASSRVETT